MQKAEFESLRVTNPAPHFFNALEQAAKLQASETGGGIFSQSSQRKGRREDCGGWGIVLCLGGWWWCCLPVVVMLARRGLLSPPEVSRRRSGSTRPTAASNSVRPLPPAGPRSQRWLRVRLESVAVSKSEQVSWGEKWQLFRGKLGAAATQPGDSLRQHPTRRLWRSSRQNPLKSVARTMYIGEITSPSNQISHSWFMLTIADLEWTQNGSHVIMSCQANRYFCCSITWQLPPPWIIQSCCNSLLRCQDGVMYSDYPSIQILLSPPVWQ